MVKEQCLCGFLRIQLVELVPGSNWEVKGFDETEGGDRLFRRIGSEEEVRNIYHHFSEAIDLLEGNGDPVFSEIVGGISCTKGIKLVVMPLAKGRAELIIWRKKKKVYSLKADQNQILWQWIDWRQDTKKLKKFAKKCREDMKEEKGSLKTAATFGS